MGSSDVAPLADGNPHSDSARLPAACAAVGTASAAVGTTSASAGTTTGLTIATASASSSVSPPRSRVDWDSLGPGLF